ncbi:MAG: deoxyribose-phosphate aldolase [Candidatus Delongbacteria bacterium]|nr:deoxyribose-phosphate aldolase [Candidatus Delongbacteria bacterium]
MDQLKRLVAGMIDYALLAPQLSDQELDRGCETGLNYRVASLCVKPYHVPRTAMHLKDSPVALSTVIDFPHGNNPLSIKLLQIETAMREGAIELDAVITIGKVFSEDWDGLEREIGAMTRLVHDGSALIKIIFETGYLKSETIIRLCKICDALGVDFIKTSTGFGYVRNPQGGMTATGATEEVLRLMLDHAGGARVKASGGIKDFKTALHYREMGVARLGTSSPALILE